MWNKKLLGNIVKIKNLVLLSMFVFLCGCASLSRNPLTLACVELGLHTPVTVTGATYRPGGGVFSCRLSGAKGEHFLFCIDARVGSRAEDLPTTGRMFSNAKHPDDKGAVLLPVDSPIEDAALVLVVDWFTREFTRGQILVITASRDGLTKQKPKDIYALAVLDALTELRPEIASGILGQ